MDRHDAHKSLIAPLRRAMHDFTESDVRAGLDALLAADAIVRLPFPFAEMTGSTAFYDGAYAPMLTAIPDLERRDTIVMAGPTPEGADWVGCCGYYTGLFVLPWLDIPPTGHQVHLRFHEFFRFENGRVTEIQALWDIPEVMMQAGAWPMPPSLGREWHVPSPATQDGIIPGPRDEARSAASCEQVRDMLAHLQKHPGQGGPEVMEMHRFWHPRMNWYGPSGIGTGRGIKGFRDWHQIPFLNAMPDRGAYGDQVTAHSFGDNDYVAVTGWPNMMQTLAHGGWLGIAPPNRQVTLRSLDFWRLDGGLIRENWVMIDLLDLYDQIGVDVLARMREFNKARFGFHHETGRVPA
ncbi:ester cyclase [Paracoccus sp. 2205BS29-5]|uniref:Ester cyclase n=2 Tax=Paracoccus spongiarum TaxID=3064387 RepID=A0ABT9JGS3_9RHOB|nr:ester cyclase [Paracoccus sp. 2205BS29-5]MDP5308915.1 ester cyclase [Paracoccus sp. 2205BS29-5]